jgi:hypothetical protein
LQDVVAVGNKYPWANPSSAGAGVRRDKLLHSLCSAKTQAAKSWVLPNRVQGLSFVFSFQSKTEGKFDLTKPAIENGFRAIPGNANAIGQSATLGTFLELIVRAER